MNTKVNPRTTSVPQYRLRRLVQRAIRVLDRHQGSQTVLASVGEAFRQSGSEYIALYDHLATNKHVRARELREGRAAVAEMTVKVRTWLGWLASDIEGFEPKDFTSNPAVPDDALSNAQRLIELVTKHQGGQSPLPYGDQLLSELTIRFEAAKKEWTEAQDVIVAHQESQARLRDMAGEMQKRLVALRRTLRATLGSRHVDYQKLRLTRASQIDIEDPEIEAGHAEPGDAVPSPASQGPGLEPVESNDEDYAQTDDAPEEFDAAQ